MEALDRTTNQTTGGSHNDPGKTAGNPETGWVVAIATLGKDGPHMVNTWNSYIRIITRRAFVHSCWYMHKNRG